MYSREMTKNENMKVKFYFNVESVGKWLFALLKLNFITF